MIFSDSIEEIIIIFMMGTIIGSAGIVCLIAVAYGFPVLLIRGIIYSFQCVKNRISDWFLMEPQRTDMSRCLSEAIDINCRIMDELNTENSLFRESFDKINHIMNDDDYRSDKLDRIRQVMENHSRQLDS